MAQVDTDAPQVDTFDVDLRDSPRLRSASQEEDITNKPKIQLSVDRAEIEANPNELALSDVEVRLIREILFSKINISDFDKKEVERFSNDDHSIRRYVRLGQDRTSTLYRTAACIKACLEWRKSVEVYNMKYDDFSDEVRLKNVIYMHGKTVTDENILWLRACCHRRSQNTEEYRNYLAYNLEKIDKLSDKCGFIVCIDCMGAGPSCVDLDFVRHFVKIVMFFRGNLRYVLIHDMGWLLNATWRIIKSWLPLEQQDGVKMASKKELCQYVASEQLPEYFMSA